MPEKCREISPLPLAGGKGGEEIEQTGLQSASAHALTHILESLIRQPNNLVLKRHLGWLIDQSRGKRNSFILRFPSVPAA
ncbi:hypothetical protein, partial [Aestuariivirga sp.]|uniref:hypothetical protein n=1 Tax=Aestuariivirga sp. TaxID=2650926 RepID=UPI0035ADF43E